MTDPMRTPRGWKESQLAQMVFVRLREFVREPEAFFWVFVFPILLAGGLGIAFRNKPAEIVHVAVIEAQPALSATPAMLGPARQLLAGNAGIDVQTMTVDAAALALRTGKVALIAVRGVDGSIEYRYDPAREESRTARLVFDNALQRAMGRTDASAPSDKLVTEKGARYIDFLIPGLLGMNLLGSGVWGLGFALVDLRRKKLLKRLVATPMSRSQFLASFMISRLVLLCIEVTALVGFGVLAFGVPLRGPLWVLALIAVIGSLCFSGLGLMISSRVKTMEGASGLMNAAMLPMWVLSGVFFASSNFPAVMQPIVKALPLTAVNDALRANMLQGASIGGVLPQLAVIGIWTVLCFTIALRFFDWK
jgi:ABC-2 type transport system permease protein